MKQYTSSYLGLLKKYGKIKAPITDGVRKIGTIEIGEPEYPTYSRPKIIYNRFLTSSMAKSIIMKTKDIGIVNDLGFEIASIPVGEERWYPYQRVEYKLIKSGLITGGTDILNSVPPSHYIEIDKTNKRIRLVGPNCRTRNNELNRTDWEEIR